MKYLTKSHRTCEIIVMNLMNIWHMDILLLWSYIIFSCLLIKRSLQRAKTTISSFYPLPSYWINVFHVSKLNWRQFFPCHNVHVYSTSIIWHCLIFLLSCTQRCLHGIKFLLKEHKHFRKWFWLHFWHLFQLLDVITGC